MQFEQEHIKLDESFQRIQPLSSFQLFVDMFLNNPTGQTEEEGLRLDQVLEAPS